MTRMMVDGNCWLAELEAEDGPALEELVEACADYYDAAFGRPPFPAEAQSMYMALPDGADPHSKLLLGVFRSGDAALVGVLDVIRNHPKRATWDLGLLLLRPEERGKRLGAQVYGAFEQLARSEGANEIVLLTREDMHGAHRFWVRRGFVDEPDPSRTDGFVLMRRYLDDSRSTGDAAL